MYYISKTNELGLSEYDMCYYIPRIVKRLSDFSHAQPEEGSEWIVRKKRKISEFDVLPVYVWKSGKLNKTTKEVIFLKNYIRYKEKQNDMSSLDNDNFCTHHRILVRTKGRRS